MKKSDSQKLDTITTMLADMVDLFGKRFDKIDDNAAAVEKKLTDRIDGLKVKVEGVQNTLDAQTLARQDENLPARVTRLEESLRCAPLTPQLRYDALELLANLGGRLFKGWIVDRQHRCNRIDRGHLDATVGKLLHDHITRQHGPDLVFQLKRFVCELGIAGAEDPIFAVSYADLLAKRLLHVDLGNDAESFRFQRGDRAGDSIIE